MEATERNFFEIQGRMLLNVHHEFSRNSRNMFEFCCELGKGIAFTLLNMIKSPAVPKIHPSYTRYQQHFPNLLCFGNE